jgi:hypothetical protein
VRQVRFALVVDAIDINARPRCHIVGRATVNTDCRVPKAFDTASVFRSWILNGETTIWKTRLRRRPLRMRRCVYPTCLSWQHGWSFRQGYVEIGPSWKRMVETKAGSGRDNGRNE